MALNTHGGFSPATEMVLVVKSVLPGDTIISVQRGYAGSTPSTIPAGAILSVIVTPLIGTTTWSPSSPQWVCWYCDGINDGHEVECEHCGGPRLDGE